jgi:hypothetical protein
VQSLTTRRRDAGKLVDETDPDDDADAEFSGDLLGCFAVFDGHVRAKAAEFARRRILPTLLSHGADAPGSPLETSCVAAFHALEDDFRRSVASPFSRCLPSKKKTTTKPSGSTSDGVGGAQTTQKNLARNAHGGTTACVVFLQRRRGGVIPGYKGHHARRSDSVVAERVDLGAFSSSHRSPYDRVRVVHADP